MSSSRPSRPKRSVFRQLRFAMLTFGALVGVLFPPFARVLLETRGALSPVFFAACIAAGLIVGYVNYLLFTLVVSRELGRVIGAMRQLHGVLSTQGTSTFDEPVHLPITSDDAVGDLAETFNTVTHTITERLNGLFKTMQQSSASQLALERDRLKKSEAKYRNVVESVKEVIFQTDETWCWTFLNPAWEQLTGFEVESSLGTSVLSYLHPDDHTRTGAALEPLHHGQAIRQLEVRYITRAGESRWGEVLVQPVLDAAGQCVGTSGTLADITERKKAKEALERVNSRLKERVEARTQQLKDLNEQLQHDAFHDALTGLPNRALFMDRLDHAIKRKLRDPDTSFAVLFLDFDRFKNINDSLGHGVGDAFLEAVGERLETCLRPGDTAARLGGDEFTALLETSSEEALQIAERVQEVLSAPYDLNGHEVASSASIGVVLDAGGSAEEVLRDADIAMYHAKALGKARTVVFEPEMREHTLARIELESDLRHAVEKEQLELHYQPILHIEREEVTGFEALVRWRHPVKGQIMPNDFIPVAEETGAIIELDRWVLRRACHQLALWQTQTGRSLTLSVNLSSRQFSRTDLPQFIEAVLVEAELNPQCLKLELTESLFMSATPEVASVLEALYGLGVGLHIDDFGTGYSSLGYLQRFTAHTLKIDRSFIAKLEQPESAELVRTITTLAHNLGMNVVAEGVETQAQLSKLRDMACEYAQGYLFAKPLPPHAAEALISSDQPTNAL